MNGTESISVQEVEAAFGLWLNERRARPAVPEWLAILVNHGGQAVMMMLPRADAIVAARFLGMPCADRSVVERIEEPLGREGFWLVRVDGQTFGAFRLERTAMTAAGGSA